MTIDAATRLYCIIGNPVSHSMSPAIHNAAFADKGINAAYVAFRVEDVEGAIEGIRALGIHGASVTIPHKVTIIPLLDRVDEVAKMIGAVNTVVRKGDELIGYNTDGPGAARALKEKVGDLSGKNVVIIGSGGAARAVAITLAVREGVASIVILGVIKEELKKLARDVARNCAAKVEGHIIEDKRLSSALKKADILINASPLGMHPEEDSIPVPASLLRAELDVFDVVYNPLETKLIREAKKRGCRTVPGVEMFLNQGVLQFEMWTGRKAPVDLMRRIVMERLSK